MNLQLPSTTPDARVGEIIKLVIMAVGGQGGGVLTSWIESVARASGYDAQATSVAGVSQRTGATVYYVEMTQSTGREPIFALAPSAGDVDVLIAAEMMEVGRAILRGFVTPDRTTLIGSTHRALAVSEKSAPGDGIADADEVHAAAENAAQKLILANMEQLAFRNGSVISASLLGVLAGSGALPFDRTAYEEAIREAGKGVEPSLRAFAAGYETAQNGEESQQTDPYNQLQLVGPEKLVQEWRTLESQAASLPEPIRDMALAGLRNVVDFQNCAYGSDYMDRLQGIVARDDAGHDWQLSIVAAKYLANAMAYNDIIRVADLKTRKQRFNRIHDEMGAREDQLIQLTEFFHPRAEEIAGMLPNRMGARVEANAKSMARLDRWFGKGRRLRTDSLGGFLMLHFVGGLKRYRLRTRRHAVETAFVDNWIERSLAPLADDYATSVELLRCQRLIKGYSDTHARGLSKFDMVMNAARLLTGRKDAAEWIARLREAALQDPEGRALEGAIKTVRSFA